MGRKLVLLHQVPEKIFVSQLNKKKEFIDKKEIDMTVDIGTSKTIISPNRINKWKLDKKLSSFNEEVTPIKG